MVVGNLLGKKHKGNKWGAKFLRTPEFLWEPIDQGVMVPLASICEMEYGNKTGIAEFFVLNDDRIKEYNIEDRFLEKFISSTEEVECLVVSPKTVEGKLFLCELSEEELKTKSYKGAFSYVNWGSKQFTKKKGSAAIGGVAWPDVKSVKSNSPYWYSLSLKKPGDFIVSRLIRERFFVATNPTGIPDSDMFCHGTFEKEKRDLGCAVLNSTIVYLMMEIYGRHNVPGRFNIYGFDFELMPVPNPALFNSSQAKKVVQLFNTMSERNVIKILDEMQQPDRLAMDEVVFEAIGFDQHKRDLVYQTLRTKVENRRTKAGSL
jgi:hypothetical protein